MNKNTALSLIVKAALNKDVSTNFDGKDVNEVAIEALCAHYGVDANTSARELRKMNDFTVIEEIIDEILPARIENIMGSFATVKTYGRDEEVKYTIKGLGKRRALLGIVKGARGGIYKAHRLDSKDLFIKTEVYTAAVNVTLENILLGQVTLGDLMDNILQGIEYQIYKDIVSALRTAKTLAPAANVASAAGLSTSDVDNITRVVSAYGVPTIICFKSLAQQFSNVFGSAGTYNPNMPSSDLDEYKSQGYVGSYKGTKIVMLPNFIMDEVTNSTWIFSEADLFILPTNEKPVIVAMRGEGYVKENEQPSGGAEQMFHKIMGTAILAYNNIGVFTDTTVAAAEADKFIV